MIKDTVSLDIYFKYFLLNPETFSGVDTILFQFLGSYTKFLNLLSKKVNINKRFGV